MVGTHSTGSGGCSMRMAFQHLIDTTHAWSSHQQHQGADGIALQPGGSNSSTGRSQHGPHAHAAGTGGTGTSMQMDQPPHQPPGTSVPALDMRAQQVDLRQHQHSSWL
jgi:hypothetical protein